MVHSLGNPLMSGAFSIREFELSRWELEGLDPASAFAAFRSDALTLAWTPLEDLGLQVLNIFSPRDHIFWSFRDYATFANAAFRFAQRFVHHDESKRRLDDAIKESGAARSSAFSEFLLGGITRYFGDRYMSRSSASEAGKLTGRFASIAVPNNCIEAVSRYFRLQVEIFGGDAFRRCPEADQINLSEERGTLRFRLFESTADLLSSQEKEELLAAIADKSGRSASQIPGPKSAVAYCAWTGASLRLAAHDRVKASLPAIETILRFRVDFALANAALPALEKMIGNMDDDPLSPQPSAWSLVELADLREAFRGRLLRRLADCPIVFTNPFERFRPGEVCSPDGFRVERHVRPPI